MPTLNETNKGKRQRTQKIATEIYFRRVAIPVESFFFFFVSLLCCLRRYFIVVVQERKQEQKHSLNWIQQQWKNKFWIFRFHEQTINIEPGKKKTFSCFPLVVPGHEENSRVPVQIHRDRKEAPRFTFQQGSERKIGAEMKSLKRDWSEIKLI